MSSPSVRSIGALSRESGLSISALRYYDAAGVLRPARVDPVTGYRWYTAEQAGQARLIACLRDASMPVADICEVLLARHDTAAVAQMLDRYLQRLEHGLNDARSHLDTARVLLEAGKQTIEMTVLGADLIAALRAVSFAVSTDPALPALNGVLFDFDGNTLRLVGSDRYRLAVATVMTRHHVGGAAKLIAPPLLLGNLSIEADEDVRIALHARAVTVGAVTADSIDASYPDYERLLRATAVREITVATADLIDRLCSGPTRTIVQAPNNAPHEVSVVLMDAESIQIIGEDHPDAVGFNRAFLVEALGAQSADHAVLEVGGPLQPLAILDPDRPGDVSLVMPTRLR